VSRSAIDIHTQLERTFSRTLLGDEYISTSEAATLLGTSQSRVESLARRMQLPAVKIGKRWQVERAEVEELAETLQPHRVETNRKASPDTEDQSATGSPNH
jgi:excisionase family DNA binding protein